MSALGEGKTSPTSAAVFTWSEEVDVAPLRVSRVESAEVISFFFAFEFRSTWSTQALLSFVDNSLFKFYTRTYCERALAGKEIPNRKIPIVAERN